MLDVLQRKANVAGQEELKSFKVVDDIFYRNGACFNSVEITKPAMDEFFDKNNNENESSKIF